MLSGFESLSRSHPFRSPGADDRIRPVNSRSYVTDAQPAAPEGAPPQARTRLAHVAITLAWLAALAVFIVAVFAASLYVTVRTVFVGRELSVPDVTGMPLEEAREILNRSDLYLEVTAERFDETVAAGAVRAQDPPAGTTIKPHRKVRLSVSLGAIQVEVPDVRGQTLRTAQIALQREGLPIGHVTFAHVGSVPGDTVMAQDPLPADVKPQDDGKAPVRTGWDGRVDLLVSRGPEERQFIMPDLADRPIGEVRQFAERAGLRLGAVRIERVPGVSRGRVVRQYPRAGYPVGRHDIISLVLSD